MFSINTLNKIKNTKSLIYYTLKITYSRINTIDAIRYSTLSSIVVFYISKDIEKYLATTITIY